MSPNKNESPQLRPFFFETTPIHETPSRKYNTYYKFIHSNGLAKLPRTYLTTTITSGGYSVLTEQVKEKPNSDGNYNFFNIVLENGEFTIKTPFPARLSYPEVLQKNIKLAEAYRQDLLKSRKVSAEKSLLIFPPDLGKVPDWTQFDYNLFWLNIISGIRPKDAKKIEEYFINSSFDYATYNNKNLSSEIRKRAYIEFVQDYLRYINQNGCKVDPISEFIQLVDPKGSLGSFVEEFLAKSLGVPISRVVINNMEAFSGKDAARELIRQQVEIPAARIDNIHEDPVTLVRQPSFFDKSKK